jgi:hypothetical protein
MLTSNIDTPNDSAIGLAIGEKQATIIVELIAHKVKQISKGHLKALKVKRFCSFESSFYSRVSTS